MADLPATLSRKQWAEKITERYQDSVRAILDVGRYLIDAKDELPHGEFGLMVDEDLPFSWLTANRFMAIARNPVLSNSSHGKNLPSSWRTLSELARLPDEVLEAALVTGRITPELKRKEIPALIPQEPPRRRPPETSTVQELSELVHAGKKFGAIYMDPPWSYENRATRAAADSHYRTMPLEEIAALPVKELAAESSHLHLWTTNAFLFACQSLFEAWDFEYKGVLVWIKPGFGIGNYWRVAHEFLVLGVRGNSPFLDHSQLSWFLAERLEHSEKPETVREMIEAVSPGPYLELFGRKLVQGWTVWGDEV